MPKIFIMVHKITSFVYYLCVQYKMVSNFDNQGQGKFSETKYWCIVSATYEN